MRLRGCRQRTLCRMLITLPHGPWTECRYAVDGYRNDYSVVHRGLTRTHTQSFLTYELSATSISAGACTTLVQPDRGRPRAAHVAAWRQPPDQGARGGARRRTVHPGRQAPYGLDGDGRTRDAHRRE